MRILRPSAASLNNPDEPNIVLGVHAVRMGFDRSTGVIRTTHDIRRTIQNLFVLPMYSASEDVGIGVAGRWAIFHPALLGKSWALRCGLEPASDTKTGIEQHATCQM